MYTETATKPYRLASGEGLADVWWKTGRITVKAGPDETGNAFSQFEVDDPRGSGPPLHVHHSEDETFYILEGEVTMFVGDERIDLAAGDLLVRPARRPPTPTRPLRARTDARDDLSLGLRAGLRRAGVPVTGAEPPTEPVMPPIPEMVRQFRLLRRRDPRPGALAQRPVLGAS